MDVITTHLHADFDGLASMVAARKLYPGALLVFPGSAQDTIRSFLAVHDLGMTRLKDLDLEQVTRLILVDTQEPDRIGVLKSLFDRPQVRIHVYDHHPNVPDSDQPAGESGLPRADVRKVEPVGATTTILIEQLQSRAIPLTPFEATVLALGLYEETGSLAYVSTTPRDLEAAAHLLRAGADLTVVSDTLRSHLDPDQIALLNDLLHASETYYLEGRKVMLATSPSNRYRGDLADIVHKMADMEGFDAVIAAIGMDDKIEIIARSRRPEIDVGQLAREFGGGGHAVAAAACVKGRTLVEVKEQLARLLTERYRPTLLAKDVMTQPAQTIGDDATVSETERHMTTYGVNVLPVLDAGTHYVGLVTREIIQKALFHQFGASPVSPLMQADAYCAQPETPFHEIETRMIERNQRFVPVLHDQQVVGVITRTDLLRTLHDDVLLAARARAKGRPATDDQMPSPFRRNVKGLLRERLPAPVYALLERAGELAERTGISAFVVGGFVRDLLLGRPNLDLDLVVEGDGIAYARALGAELTASVNVHERFGTATLAFPDGFKLDVATARTEYYEYPTALPTVERSSIKKDLYRRDFTINTLAIRLNTGRFGELLDFYGGRHDLKERRIRALHSLSFVEDPTRVFRAIRFEQRFGFTLGKETLMLIKGAVTMDLFHRLSGSRLLEELVLLLSEEEPRQAIARLAKMDLLRFIHPSLTWSPRLATLLKAVEDALDWYKIASLNVNAPTMDAWVVYVMALMDVLSGKAVQDTLTRLAMPERQAEKIRGGRSASRALLRRLAQRPPLKSADTYHALRALSEEALLLLMAKTTSDAVTRKLSVYLTTDRYVKPSLTGEDLKTLGLKPGPLYRKILDRLLDARLNGTVKTEADERAFVTILTKA